jgi:hypothetical protein
MFHSCDPVLKSGRLKLHVRELRFGEGPRWRLRDRGGAGNGIHVKKVERFLLQPGDACSRLILSHLAFSVG